MVVDILVLFVYLFRAFSRSRSWSIPFLMAVRGCTSRNMHVSKLEQSA